MTFRFWDIALFDFNTSKANLLGDVYTILVSFYFLTFFYGSKPCAKTAYHLFVVVSLIPATNTPHLLIIFGFLM